MSETKKFGNLSRQVRITTSGRNSTGGNLAHPTLPEMLNKNKIKAVVVGQNKTSQNQNSMTFETLGALYGISGNSKKVEIKSSYNPLKVKKDNSLG